MAKRDLRLQRAQQAIDSIGLGFDITQDICFDNFKRSPRLIQINKQDCRDLNIPGERVSIPNVPSSIKCLGGESFRIQSEVLTYTQVCYVCMYVELNVTSTHLHRDFRFECVRGD